MSTHNIYYYPYAFFDKSQLPLLKAAALYFDKLYVLDPLKANVLGGEIDSTIEKKSGIFDKIKNKLQNYKGRQTFEADPNNELVEAIEILEKEKILVRLKPEEILHKYEKEITKAILLDQKDPKFIEECHSSDIKNWKLALAKIPKELREKLDFQPLENSMKNLLGKIPNSLKQNGSSEFYTEESRQTMYMEVNSNISKDGEIEYRFGNYPIEIGESIMINHALFGGLLHLEATPLTDDPFHNKILELKIKRANNSPEIKKILHDIEKTRRIKKNLLALKTLRDIDLAIIPPELPFQKIIEYRNDHEKQLDEVRKELGNLARTIKETPWSKEFAEKIETDIIPTKIYPLLVKCKDSRDKWFRNHKNELIQFGATAASMTLTIMGGAPLPIPELVTGGSTLLTSGLDMAENEDLYNGFHYLMKIK